MSKKRLLMAIVVSLVVGAVATLATFFVVHNQTPDNSVKYSVDSCPLIYTNNHGYPSTYKKSFSFPNNWQTVGLKDRQKCKASMDNYPLLSARGALIDASLWSGVSLLAILGAVSLKYSLKRRDWKFYVVSSLILGLLISSGSYYIPRTERTSSSNPCPVLYTIKSGYPFAYRESYSASCILDVGYFAPDKTFASRYIENTVFWSAISLVFVFAAAETRGKKNA